MIVVACPECDALPGEPCTRGVRRGASKTLETSHHARTVLVGLAAALCEWHGVSEPARVIRAVRTSPVFYGDPSARFPYATETNEDLLRELRADLLARKKITLTKTA